MTTEASPASAPGPASCPFCGTSESRAVFTAVDEHSGRFPLRSCSRCGTRYLFPVPSSEVLSRAYASAYYGDGDTKFGGPIERLRDFAAAGRARKLVAGLPEKARALDVGCGDGRFLRLLGQHRAGLELHGIELPGPAADRAARIPGLQVHPGMLHSTDFPDASFDVVSLVHVIEHLPDPSAALEKLVRWLKPGGKLFLAFPNIESWQAKLFGAHWFHLDPPRHLTLVPPAAVISRLAPAGLALADQRHWCAEQNLYGWIQSALNACDADRNLLYERLKRNRTYRSERWLAPVLHLAGAALLAGPSVLIDAAAAIARSGATVELTFCKSQSAHVS